MKVKHNDMVILFNEDLLVIMRNLPIEIKKLKNLHNIMQIKNKSL